MKQKKNRKYLPYLHSTLKPLVALTMLGMSMLAQAATSPFAVIPLHLQTSVVESGGTGVKPNILIQVDDSASMNSIPEVEVHPGGSYFEFTNDHGQIVRINSSVDAGAVAAGWKYKVNGHDAKVVATNSNTPSRLKIVKQALNTVINPSSGYLDKANIGLITLWDRNKQTKPYIDGVMNGTRSFALSETQLRSMINDIEATSNTPVTHRYMDAIKVLKKALQYRCQKSYVVLFSDGDSVSQAELPNVNSSNQTFSWTQTATTNTVDDKTTYSTWWASNPPITYSFPSDMDKYTHTPPVNTDAGTFTIIGTLPNGKEQSIGSVTMSGGIRFPAMFIKNGNNYTWNLNTTNGWTVNGSGGAVQRIQRWVDHPDVLPFVANMAYENDAKTAADGTDAAGKSWDDPEKGAGGKPLNMQRIETFAIGFGSGLSNVGLHALNNASTANNFKAFTAQNQEDLDKAFKTIFDNIKENNQIDPPKSVATIAPSVGFDVASNNVLNAATTIHLDLASGSSEVRFYKLAAIKNGNSTSYQVIDTTYGTPDFSDRKVLINLGGENNAVTWYDDKHSNNITNSQYKISNANFAIETKSDNSNENEWKTALMPWMTRSKPDSEINHSSYAITYRKRHLANASQDQRDTYHMGDVLDSSLTTIGDIVHNRQKYLLTSANDGMVYIFESNNDDAHPYKLKLNYMPAGMQRESSSDLVMHYYKDFAKEGYVTQPDQPHEYLLNGNYVLRETDSSVPERRVFMASNMGQAGRGAFALNIGGKTRNTKKAVGMDVDENEWPTSVPLFETQKQTGAADKMGYTIGAPQIARMSAHRSATYGASTMKTDINRVYHMMFVNSGISHPVDAQGTRKAIHDNLPYPVNSDNTESALYVYHLFGGEENVGLPMPENANNTLDLETGIVAIKKAKAGDLVKKLVANPTGGGLAQATLVDINLDGVVDIAYAGDYKGNLYRFDFRQNTNGNFDQWKVSRIFQTQRLPTGLHQPITSAPAVVRNSMYNYMVVFGTGSELYQSDLDNKDTQSVYGIYDDLTIENPQALEGTNQLLQQSLVSEKNLGNGLNSRDLSDLKIDKNQHKGWFFNLKPNTGERVVVKPTTLLKTIILTTRQYSRNTVGATTSEDPCIPSKQTKSTSAISWLMQLRSDTGGKLPKQGEPDADDFPYIDFARVNDTGKYTVRNEKSLLAGISYIGGGILSFVLFGGEINADVIGGYGNNMTLSGDAGGSGRDVTLSQTDREPNLCWNTSSGEGQLISSNSTDTSSSGTNNTFSVLAKTCDVGTIRRISWREIF